MATAFQVVSEAHAAPGTVATAPWLDGRPVVVYMAPSPAWRPASGGGIHLVRYDSGDGPRCGVLEGDAIREVKNDIFSDPSPTGRVLRTSDVRLLSPLGPEQLNSVTLLEHRGVDTGLRATDPELLQGGPWGPDDPIDMGHVESCTVRSALVLVVGRPGEPLGVTGATLVEEPGTGVWRLALGPSLAKGADLEMTHGLPSQVVAAAERAVKDARLRMGDVVLVPLRESGARLGAGTHGWVTTAEGFGPLRNDLLVGRAASEVATTRRP